MSRDIRLAYTVYLLEELSEKAKQKAIEKNRTINVDYGDWYTGVVEGWQEILGQCGFCNAEIYFRGFWSQGDGACFDASVNLDFFFASPKYRHLKRIQNLIEVTITKNQYANHYHHAKTRYVEVALDDYSGRRFPRVGQLLDQLQVDIEQARESYCNGIYEALRQEYESQTSDNAVAETLVANEYEFMSDGELLFDRRIQYSDLLPLAV